MQCKVSLVPLFLNIVVMLVCLPSINIKSFLRVSSGCAVNACGRMSCSGVGACVYVSCTGKRMCTCVMQGYSSWGVLPSCQPQHSS